MGFGAINVDLGGILGGLGKVGTLFKDIREAITGKAIEDPTKRMEVEAKLLEIEQLLTTAQTNINKIEAAHPSIFVSGWRPGTGWVCLFGLVFSFIIRPIVQWVLIIAGSDVMLPTIESGVLVSLLVGMLGLGGLRTYEGLKGIKRSN